MSERYRCFVAVNLPPPLCAGVAAFLALDAARIRGVTWAAPAQLHLTLKFLGEIEAGDVRAVAGALDAALAPLAPFTAELRGAGAFPSPARPRVVWIGVGAGAAALCAMAAAVESALAPLGFPPEGRPFEPHLTIGRVKAPPRDRGALPRLIASAAERAWGGFLVPAAHLMRSELFPSGATYSILHETCLSGSPREAEGAHR